MAQDARRADVRTAQVDSAMVSPPPPPQGLGFSVLLEASDLVVFLFRPYGCVSEGTHLAVLLEEHQSNIQCLLLP